MNKIYYLASCDTCRKILKSLPHLDRFELVDIRENPLSEETLEQLKSKTGSYEKLFSRKAQRYKSLGLKDQDLGEADYKKYLLEHYTFLSRPVLVIGGNVYVGNGAANIEAVHRALE
jgi:arsenate reductase